MATSDIVIRGAREHNLRDVSLDLAPGTVDLPDRRLRARARARSRLTPFMPKGSGGTSRASPATPGSSSGRCPSPRSTGSTGSAPSISIQQKTGGRNPRSTVGTITEINDYLRVLFARVGQGHCPQCDRPVAAQTREQIVARVLETCPPGTAFSVLAPVVRGQKGEYKDLFADLSRAGLRPGQGQRPDRHLSDNLALDRQIKHDIEVVDRPAQGRVPIRSAARLAEAVEQALKLGEGTVIVAVEGQPDLLLSSHYACASCGLSFDPPSPQLFSFNSPQGMCPACDGLGVRHDFDPDLLVPDPSLSVWDGAIAPLGPGQGDGQVAQAPVRGRRRQPRGRPRRPAQGDDAQGPLGQARSRSGARPGCYGTGDRMIVHRWKNRGEIWSHAEKWDGRRHRAAREVPQVRPEVRQGPARAVHAEHDLPRMPGRPASTRVPGPCASAARRSSSWGPCRSAGPRFFEALRVAGEESGEEWRVASGGVEPSQGRRTGR